MKKFSIVFLALATAIAVTPAAKADTTEIFTLASGGYTSVFDLTVNGLGQVDGGSVTITGFNLDGTFNLVTNPTPGSIQTLGSFQYDNLWVPGGEKADYYGDLFVDNGTYVNLYWDNGWAVLENYNGFNGPSNQPGYGTSPGITPEPTTLLLLGTGLLGLAIVAFKKAKPTSPGLVLQA